MEKFRAAPGKTLLRVKSTAHNLPGSRVYITPRAESFREDKGPSGGFFTYPLASPLKGEKAG